MTITARMGGKLGSKSYNKVQKTASQTNRNIEKPMIG